MFHNLETIARAKYFVAQEGDYRDYSQPRCRHDALDRHLLNDDPSQGPDDDEGVADIDASMNVQQRQDDRDGYNRHGPGDLAESEAVPADADQGGDHVGYGGDGDPSQVDAEGEVDVEPLLPGGLASPYVEPEVDCDEGCEEHEHGDEGQDDQLVVPQEYPDHVGGAADPEEVADLSEEHGPPPSGGGLVDGESEEQEVDDPPYREDVACGDEEVRVGVGELRRGLPVQGQGVREDVHRDHGDEPDDVDRLQYSGVLHVFHVVFLMLALDKRWK